MCASKATTGGARWALRQMTLTVTERCNQRCEYCYVDTDGGRDMSLSTAGQALDMFFRHAAPTGALTGTRLDCGMTPE